MKKEQRSLSKKKKMAALANMIKINEMDKQSLKTPEINLTAEKLVRLLYVKWMLRWF
jgi:hypothetical protein